MDQFPDAEVLLTPKEVAKFFHVNTKTVTRWAISGELTPIRTLGGHRRYRQSEVIEKLRNYKKWQRKDEEIEVTKPEPKSL